MNAEILCVGTELLLGDTVNTNAAYLARELAACGVGCYYQTVVGDNPERLRQSISLALSRADIVITTGGLGPTDDDLTKETVAEYFGLPLELYQPALDQICEFYRKMGRPMPPNNKKQAMMPKDATVFLNDRGTAPGLVVQGGDRTAILLPGPPREMTAMFEQGVKPWLLQHSGATLVSQNVHFFGIGESQLAYDLQEYMQEHQNPTVAPYAKEGEVLLRVTARAATQEEGSALTEPVVEELCTRFAQHLYGVDIGTLENALVQALLAQSLQIAVAESCTGGLVAKRITDIAGASEVFGCGVCTYSNRMKEELLGVKPETITVYGAVSEQTACEMAQGVRKLGNADIGLSITGIAGPGGGTDEKPVGLVYVALCDSNGVHAKRLDLSRGYGGERDFIRNLAANNALYLALRTVQQQDLR